MQVSHKVNMRKAKSHKWKMSTIEAKKARVNVSDPKSKLGTDN